MPVRPPILEMLKEQPRLIVLAQTHHKLIYVSLQLQPRRGGRRSRTDSQLTSAASLAAADFGI